MLELRHIDHYAHASRVDRLVAERDVILTYVLKALSKGSDPLLTHLAFKGGTCLKKIYLGKTGRVSLDLDFTSVDLTRRQLQNRFKRILDGKTHHDINFRFIDEYSRDEESYGANISYSHNYNQASFKVETSFRERPILKVISFRILEELYFKYLDFKPFEVPCLQKEELIAEKIRAAFQRMGSRDLYDLYLFAKKPYNSDLVKKLVVVKLWNVRDPFNPISFFDDIEKESYDLTELRNLVRGKTLPRRRQFINIILQNYSYLKDLNEELKIIANDSKPHKETKLVKKIVDQTRKMT
ncbi:MAG: nucleotidyl transferase AbiEii/AbiGii toxin family protein [Candidatus Bathyarchaeia archaeon]